MITVGLTGGIGSGKSTVASFFVELGVPVYNSDQEARKLMKTSKKIKKAIKSLLGKNAYNGKRLNKTYISAKIFKDRNLLHELNAIVHPAVKKDFLKWKTKQKAPYVIQETALIFENKSQDLYDQIILVVAPENERLQRIIARDGITTEQVQDRFNNQLSDELKSPLADHIIQNITLSETKKKVQQVNKAILARIE
jgi:dephospho-CoA kinase